MDKNTIYITQVYVKKDDKSKKVREIMINRDARIYDDYLKVKTNINNPEYKKVLLEENEKIEQSVFENLTKKTKGEDGIVKN